MLISEPSSVYVFIKLRHLLSKYPDEEQGTDAPGGCSLIMKYGVSLQTAGTGVTSGLAASGEIELKCHNISF